MAGSYAAAQTVTIKSTTAAASICYTTNGTIPTATVPGTCDANVGESSLANRGTVSVTASETINSIATLTGGANSGNVAAAYVIPVANATPTASPAAGSFTSTQTVAISLARRKHDLLHHQWIGSNSGYAGNVRFQWRRGT